MVMINNIKTQISLILLIFVSHQNQEWRFVCFKKVDFGLTFNLCGKIIS